MTRHYSFLDLSKHAMQVAACPSRNDQQGFTLLEVLVVILVLSFGLLGMAGLQANTAKYKINSWARASASVQFSSLADAIRTNPQQAGASYFPSATPAVNGYVFADDWDSQQLDTLTLARDCLTTNCTPEQRAAFDLMTWRREVRALFPQGAVAIAGNRATSFTTTIAWFDKQFVDTTGAPGRTPVCDAADTDPVRQSNCCPATLTGDPAREGVRCTNVSFVP